MRKKSKRNGPQKGVEKEEEADLVEKQPDDKDGEDNHDCESDSRSRRNKSLSSLFKRSRSREGNRNRHSASRDRSKSGTRDTSIEMVDESETGSEKKVDPRTHLKRMTVREALVDSRKRGKSPNRSTVHLEKRILDNKLVQSGEKLSASLPHILDQFPDPVGADENVKPTTEVKTATLPRSGNRIRGRSEGKVSERRKQYRDSHSNDSEHLTGKQTLPLDKRKYLIHRNSAENDPSVDDNVHKAEVHQHRPSSHSSRDPSPYSLSAFMEEENRRESFKQFLNLRENVSPFSSSSLALAMASTSNEHPEVTQRRFRSSRKKRQPVPSSDTPAASGGVGVILPSYEEAMSAQNVTPVSQAPQKGNNEDFVSRLSKRDAFKLQNKHGNDITPDKSKPNLMKQSDHEKSEHKPLRSSYKSPRRFGSTTTPRSNSTPNKNDSLKMQTKTTDSQTHNSADSRPGLNYQRQFKRDHYPSHHLPYASSPNNEIGSATGATFEPESQPEIVSIPYEGHLYTPKHSPVTITKAVQKNTVLKPESPKSEPNISAAVKAFKSLLTKKKTKTTEPNKDTASLINETLNVENKETIQNDGTDTKVEETTFIQGRSEENVQESPNDTHCLIEYSDTECRNVSANDTRECDISGEENTSVHAPSNTSDTTVPADSMDGICDSILMNKVTPDKSDSVPLIDECSGQSSDLIDHDEIQSEQQTIKVEEETDDIIKDDMSKSKKKKKKSTKDKPDKSEKKRSKERRKSKSKQEKHPNEQINDEINLIKEGENKPNDSLISSGNKKRKLSSKERKANKLERGRKKSKDSTRSLSIADAVIKVGRAASLSNITGSPHLVRKRFQTGSNKLMKRSLSMEDVPASSEIGEITKRKTKHKSSKVEDVSACSDIDELTEKKTKRKMSKVENCKQQKDEKTKLSLGAIIAIRMKLSRMRNSKQKRREELEVPSNTVEEVPQAPNDENDADMSPVDKRDSCDMNEAKVFYENEINVSKQAETENKDDEEQLIGDEVISVDKEIEEIGYRKKIHFQQPYCDDTISEEEMIKQRQRNTRLTSRRESKVRQRQKKVISCCKKFVAFLFSHIGLCSLVVAYCILGGFIFQKLEGDNELKKKKEMIKVREEYREKISRLAIESTMTRRSREEFRIEVDKLLLNYSIKIHRETKEAGWDGSDDSVQLEQWSFPSSLLFAITVMTTIGYGHVAPKTDYGRIVTIAYAVLGIPLTLLCLTNIGDVMAHGFRMLYGKVCCGLCCILFRPSRRKRLHDPEKGIDPSEERMVMQEEEKSEEVIHVPTSVCLLLMSAYVMLGTLLFSRWEGWDMVTGTYFCFITLSTIGFGDVVPGMNTTNWDTNEKLVLCALYLLFGLSLIAMCFNLVQEDVKAKCKWLGTKLGIIEKPVSSV